MNKLRISEIFGPTIQGEGALIGKPTVFVRAGGCDYRCSWCDTLYAVDSQFRKDWTPMTTDEVWAQVQKLSNFKPLTISLSGGNPAIQNFSSLIGLSRDAGYDVAMETQGSIVQDWFSELDHLALSPKPPSANIEFDQMKFAACVDAGPQGNTIMKIVVFDDEDYAWAQDMSERYPLLPLFLQAGNLSHIDTEDVSEQPSEHATERLRWLIDKTLTDDWFKPKILPQLHVMIWGNARGV